MYVCMYVYLYIISAYKAKEYEPLLQSQCRHRHISSFIVESKLASSKEKTMEAKNKQRVPLHFEDESPH